MTAYATADDYAALVAHLDLDPVEDVEALLDRAARDIDAYLAWAAPSEPGDRISLGALTPFAADCLRRAVASQAAYRVSVGEEDFDAEDRPRLMSVGGAAFVTTPYDRLGPAATVLLSGAGLLRRSGSAAPPPDPAVP